MKINKIISIVASIVITTNIISQSAFASPIESSVDIGFEASTEPVAPVDPEDPNLETGVPGTGQPGPLSLDWVPALDFGGGHAVSSSLREYTTTTSRPYIQVSDLRGTGSGWRITASLSSFTDGMTPSLKGAFLRFWDPTLMSATEGIEPPKPVDPVMLSSDSAETLIIEANPANMAGRGTWVCGWFKHGGGPSYISLAVPGAVATLGNHESTITWTLSDAP